MAWEALVACRYPGLSVTVDHKPVAAAAFLAARLSFDPVFLAARLSVDSVFRSALFADFLAFDSDPVFLRFAMGNPPSTLIRSA